MQVFGVYSFKIDIHIPCVPQWPSIKRFWRISHLKDLGFWSFVPCGICPEKKVFYRDFIFHCLFFCVHGQHQWPYHLQPVSKLVRMCVCTCLIVMCIRKLADMVVGRIYGCPSERTLRRQILNSELLVCGAIFSYFSLYYFNFNNGISKIKFIKRS